MSRFRSPRLLFPALLLAAGLVLFFPLLAVWMAMGPSAPEGREQSSLRREGGEMVWAVPLPRPVTGATVEARARVVSGVPGAMGGDELAGAAIAGERWYPNHAVEVARFPAPTAGAWLHLSLESGEERFDDWRWVAAAEGAGGDAAGAREVLREEIIVARQYGVDWPEVELLLEPGVVADEDPALGFAIAHARGDLRERRNLAEWWQRVPGRVLDNLEVRAGRLYRQVWLPGRGDVMEPVWVAKSAVGGADLPEQAQGVWEPFPVGDKWRTALQGIQFERLAPLLSGARHEGRFGAEEMGISARVPEPLRAEAAGGVDIFEREEGGGWGLAFFDVVVDRPDSPRIERLTLLRVEGFRVLQSSEERRLVPANPSGRVELPGLILFELP